MNKKEIDERVFEIIMTTERHRIYRDCVVIACFTALAIVFKTWWLSLFSILVMIIIKALDGGIGNE